MKATFVADVSAEFNGHAELFKLDTAMRVGNTKRGRKYNHVVVSAVNNRWATETYIFPATQSGEILDWTELHGSYKGDTSIDRALEYGGYEVVGNISVMRLCGFFQKLLQKKQSLWC